MTTWAARRTEIRDELQETSPGFWTQGELLKYANRAYQRMIRRLRVEETSALTMVVGQEAYSLPSDFYLARRIELETTPGNATSWQQIPEIPIDLRRPGDPLVTATLTAFPLGYYIYEGEIHMVPAPDRAYAGTLYYYRDATALVNDADPLVYPKGIDPERFDEVFDWYVCAQALRKRQDPAYTTYLGDFAAGLSDLTGDAAQRGQSGPLMVHDDWQNE